jgi:hypothetical protein
METCYLFALGGAFPGSNDPRTCGSCPGHLYAKAAHKAHCERTGEAISLRDYYRTNVDVGANPFVERVRHSAWMAQEHGL